MQLRSIPFRDGFHVIVGNSRSQAAAMVLAPGETVGGPDNRHQDSDQWLYVVSGEGTAMVEGAEHDLSAGVLLLIESGETHEIRSTGSEPLQTLNVYVPPAYTAEGERLRGETG